MGVAAKARIHARAASAVLHPITNPLVVDPARLAALAALAQAHAMTALALIETARWEDPGSLVEAPR